MARPQLEDGYLKLATELVKAFARANLERNESKILWAIMLKTYGWHKKADSISLTQFSDMTGMDRRAVCRTIQSLEIRNIIKISSPGRSKTNVYQIQKNHELWDQSTSGMEATTSRGMDATTGRGIDPLQVGARHACKVGAPVTHTKDKKDTKDKGESFEVGGYIGNLKALGWEQQKIKDHLLLVHQIPEAQIDEAMGKYF